MKIPMTKNKRSKKVDFGAVLVRLLFTASLIGAFKFFHKFRKSSYPLQRNLIVVKGDPLTSNVGMTIQLHRQNQDSYQKKRK
jgi:hypothetical protein